MKLNPIVDSVIFAVVVITYYGAANLFLGGISLSAFLGAFIFAWGCTAVIWWYGRRYGVNSTERIYFLNFAIITLVIICLYLLSIVNYLATGKLIGCIIGAVTGIIIFSPHKDRLFKNIFIYNIILGAVLFIFLRNIGIDVLTMASRSLQPRVLKGQQVLVSNFSFGLRVPFLPYHLIKWGNPKVGDLVIVSGPKGNPYLREVLSLKGTNVLLNADGWVPKDRLIGKAIPLRRLFD